MRKNRLTIILTTLLIFAASQMMSAQTTSFTYQGRFTDSTVAQPTNGTYQMQFALFNAASGGVQIGSTITNSNVQVTNGSFTVSLDFGAGSFDGTARFLEISVFDTGASSFVNLTPRQPVTSVPYAVRSLNATNADNATNATTATNATNATNATTATNATQLGGVAASNYVQTGSTEFVRNQTTQQTATNFNISGTGTGNIFNAQTQYNIGGNRILSNAGNDNLFAGVNAGNSITTGGRNSFFGRRAGQANTEGSSNSFFGRQAGLSTTTGNDNSFYGASAGEVNTTGRNNSFFGTRAGGANSTGLENSFFGEGSGAANTNGIRNSFFGRLAGFSNITGSRNSALGVLADFGADNLTFATAIGAESVVTSSNTIQLGRNGTDVVRIGTTGAAGATALCLNASNEIATCSSSMRYKSNVRDFNFGIDLIKKLRPVSFSWKDSGMLDVGLVAEEVAEIEPLLTIEKSGQVEGIKYDRIGVVLVNAVQEQQVWIEVLQSQVEEQKQFIEKQDVRLQKQQAEMELLKQLVCKDNPNAEVCKVETTQP